MSTQMMITQKVPGGQFTGRGEDIITLVAPADGVLTDHDDDAPRAVLDGVDRVALRASDVDQLIDNLRTIRRALD